MSPEIESRVARLEERMSTMKDGHAELKAILTEMKVANQELPHAIGRQIRRAIVRCRANPPELSPSEKRDEALKENDTFDIAKTWNKALVTLVLVITTVITLWANQYLGGSKDTAPQAPQAQQQEK